VSCAAVHRMFQILELPRYADMVRDGEYDNLGVGLLGDKWQGQLTAPALVAFDAAVGLMQRCRPRPAFGPSF
jgi:hypothetical protein